jgi:hypothetical protein
MARPKGSRNKPKTDGNGADHGAPKQGHNSVLTEDEQRALTLHHKRLYEAADALVERAKADRKAVADQAKADLGKGAMADIKDLIANADHKVARAGLERMMRLARWSGMEIGFQVDMFADRTPIEDKWAADGKTAGMAGETCQPPGSLSASAAQIWIRNWHDGQAILASAFGKKKVDAPAEHSATETSPQPFAPPEQAPVDP